MKYLPPTSPSLALELAGILALKLVLLTAIWFAFFADHAPTPVDTTAIASGLLERGAASTPASPQALPPHKTEGDSSHAH